MGTENGMRLKLEFRPSGVGGRGTLVATIGGQPIDISQLDILDPEARQRWLDGLCQGRPGIDRGAVDQRLDELAAQTTNGSDEPDVGGTQAATLVALASGAELFNDGERGYATVAVRAGEHQHHETHALNQKAFQLWLRQRFYRVVHRIPGSQAMQDAIDTLTGQAIFDRPRRPIAVRIARHEGDIYLDLANPSWQAIKVSAVGWDLVEQCPVKFLRRRGMLALPIPSRGGRIDGLRPLVNLRGDHEWQLAIGWLVGAFRPEGPYAVLAVNGEQGSAKSTTCKMLRRLIDPSEADLRAAPRDERDLMIAASNAWLVAFDNLSSMSPQLSDSLCRLATGGGFATRQLYTDDAEKIFQAARPILFNGIEELSSRPDLLDRSIVLNLTRIDDRDRQSEAELWERFEQVRPAILGALLDTVSVAIRNLGQIELKDRPRMADFVEWVTAAEPALPWSSRDFLTAYRANHGAAADFALEASAIGPALLSLMGENTRWIGTASQLLSELAYRCQDSSETTKRRDWPRSPSMLSNALRRLAPVLRYRGIDATFDEREGKDRTRLLRLERRGEAPSALSAPSASPSPAEPADGAAGADGPAPVRSDNPARPNFAAALVKRDPEVERLKASCREQARRRRHPKIQLSVVSNREVESGFRGWLLFMGSATIDEIKEAESLLKALPEPGDAQSGEAPS